MTPAPASLARPAASSPAEPNAPHPAAAPPPAVRVERLVKTYAATSRTPPKTALAGIDLAIPRGSLFGLLGPNGAGKSTLINILAGLVIKSSGRAAVWDFDIDEAPRRARGAIGVVPQELNIDPFFTPREMLDLHAGLYGVPKRERITDEILAAIGLADKADAYARTLSGGMRRRLMVGKAMVHSPPVLVLDEPTAGVDVELRRQLWSHVRALNARGTTILLTTHYLEEAEELCDRIAIIDRGQVVACDTTEALLRRVDAKELHITLAEPIVALPPALDGLHIELKEPGKLCFHYQPSRTRLEDLLERLRAAGLAIVDLTTHESDLEEVFLQLTGSRGERRG
jgi:ABC-2 type transport system ATP-binding protein